MSQTPADGATVLDPFGIWKQTRDANLELWSKFMIDLVNSDEYAEATGTALAQSLALSQPFRQALERLMTTMLQALNMPSRTEVATLAERAVNVEMRLDDLDAKLSTVQKALLAAINRAATDAVAAAVKEAVVATVIPAVQEAVKEAVVATVRPTVQEAVKEAVVATVRPTVQEAVKEAVRQGLATPGRHLRDIEAHLAALDARLAAVQTTLSQTPPPVPATEQAQEGPP